MNWRVSLNAARTQNGEMPTMIAVQEGSKGMKPGDWVVYTKPKFSTTPGPRAKEVAPNRHGEGYTYIVEKFWVIDDVLPDGRLKLKTRRGKENVLRAGDANLRRARWWERWCYRDRFREAKQSVPSARDASPSENTSGVLG
jgi:hypothetical protein